MALDIKHPEIQTLAAQLARLRNVSMTSAVVDAVRRELTREQSRQGKERLAEDLLKIGRRCAAHVKGAVSSADHAAMLYDKQGLPR